MFHPGVFHPGVFHPGVLHPGLFHPGVFHKREMMDSHNQVENPGDCTLSKMVIIRNVAIWSH